MHSQFVTDVILRRRRELLPNPKLGRCSGQIIFRESSRYTVRYYFRYSSIVYGICFHYSSRYIFVTMDGLD